MPQKGYNITYYTWTIPCEEYMYILLYTANRMPNIKAF